LPEAVSTHRRIAGTTLKLIVGTSASRALGFVRMFLMAGYFGCGAAMDAFQIAFLIPNLFRRVLGEQALESAFLPTFQSLVARGRAAEAWRTAAVVLNRLFLLLVVAAALSFVFAPTLVSGLLAPGFSAERAATAARLGRWMCPFLVFIGLAAFSGALLLAHERAWAYGLAPTLFNVGWIGTMVLLHRRLGAMSLALGVLVGGLFQLAASALPLLFVGRAPPEPSGEPDTGTHQARRVFVLALPVCAAALVARCASIVDRLIASFLEVGSVAALSYALPLVLLPFALFGLSVARASLVPLSEDAGVGDAAGFREKLTATLRLGFVLLLPITVGTALLAHPFAALLERGQFTADRTPMVAVALSCYALGLAGMGMTAILARALHAMKDTAAPLRTAGVALVVNAALSAVLAMTAMRHAGIALATSVAMTLQAILLFVAVRRRLGAMGAAGRFAPLWTPLARATVAAAAMAVPVLLLRDAAATWFPSPSLPWRFVKLLAPAAAGAAAYAGVLAALHWKALRRP